MLVVRFPTMTHFRARALEWQVAGITLMSSILLVAPINTLDNEVFQGMRAWGNDNVWAAVFALVACLRLFALWRNGAWVPSPWIRYATAVLSAGIWGIVCFNIISVAWGFLITAPFIGMVFSDIYSAGRATTDARLSRDDRLKQPEAPRVMSVA
jgi:hypothetical protein